MRIQLSIDERALAAIDAAAREAGESRSEYMRLAALERCGTLAHGFSAAQEARIRELAAK